jgi:hypothetical protein
MLARAAVADSAEALLLDTNSLALHHLCTLAITAENTTHEPLQLHHNPATRVSDAAVACVSKFPATRVSDAAVASVSKSTVLQPAASDPLIASPVDVPPCRDISTDHAALSPHAEKVKQWEKADERRLSRFRYSPTPCFGLSRLAFFAPPKVPALIASERDVE